jgi:hypothetical protein
MCFSRNKYINYLILQTKMKKKNYNSLGRHPELDSGSQKMLNQVQHDLSSSEA